MYAELKCSHGKTQEAEGTKEVRGHFPPLSGWVRSLVDSSETVYGLWPLLPTLPNTLLNPPLVASYQDPREHTVKAQWRTGLRIPLVPIHRLKVRWLRDLFGRL